jgi:disulfide bond formation protein DsbB
MYHGCSFANLDNDEYPELVIGNYDGYVYAIHGENGSMYWNYDGTYAYYNTLIADLDSDGAYEIVASGSYSISVLNHDGSLLWDESTSGSFRGAAIADLDSDDDLDVVVGDNAGLLQAFFGHNGDDIWSFNAATDYGSTPFDIDHGPVIADLNCDGNLDVFFVGGRGYSGDPENNYGCAYALTIGVTGDEGWSMFRHDYCNSGCFGQSHPGMVRGYIIDSTTKLPIFDAEVILGPISTCSSILGFYQINVQSGTYTLNVTVEGYMSHYQEIEVIGGQIAILNVSMAVDRTTTAISTSANSTTTDDTPLSFMPMILLTMSSLAVVILVLLVRYKRKQRS